MAKLITMVRTSEERYGFKCPACGNCHWIRTRGPEPIWQWNGDVERPTISPSILVRSGKGLQQVCHSFVRDGRIEFLGDCTHALAGQTVELPEWDGDGI